MCIFRRCPKTFRVCVCVPVWRLEDDNGILLSLLFLIHGLFLNPELADSSRVAGQQAPGISLRLLPQRCSHYTRATIPRVSHTGCSFASCSHSMRSTNIAPYFQLPGLAFDLQHANKIVCLPV